MRTRRPGAAARLLSGFKSVLATPRAVAKSRFLWSYARTRYQAPFCAFLLVLRAYASPRRRCALFVWFYGRARCARFCLGLIACACNLCSVLRAYSLRIFGMVLRAHSSPRSPARFFVWFKGRTRYPGGAARPLSGFKCVLASPVPPRAPFLVLRAHSPPWWPSRFWLFLRACLFFCGAAHFSVSPSYEVIVDCPYFSSRCRICGAEWGGAPAPGAWH